jgi:hypothetical protein
MTDLNARAFIKRAQSKGPCLVPRDVMSEDWLTALKMDGEVLVKIDKPRNPGHHRLLMAMLKLVLDNTDGRYKIMEDLLDDLKIATGLVQKRMNVITQQEYLIPKSIAFAIDEPAGVRGVVRCRRGLAGGQRLQDPKGGGAAPDLRDGLRAAAQEDAREAYEDA